MVWTMDYVWVWFVLNPCIWGTEMEMDGRDEFEANPMATKPRRNQSKQRASKP
jgi:hypothetical protein